MNTNSRIAGQCSDHGSMTYLTKPADQSYGHTSHHYGITTSQHCVLLTTAVHGLMLHTTVLPPGPNKEKCNYLNQLSRVQ